MAAVSLADATRRSRATTESWRKRSRGSDRSSTARAAPTAPFGALARTIVYQQLAGRAARAIYTRVRATVGPAADAEGVQATDPALNLIPTDERRARQGEIAPG
jgi:3-methyladenine DNA glycosylase/8-oxoguanine DNA glycosylase